jgi:hypothetical protein
MQISRIVEIKLTESKKEFIHFDKMKDGTWRLTFSDKSRNDPMIETLITNSCALMK